MAELSTINFLFFIIYSICMAELAMQIQISELSFWLKSWLGLNQPYSKQLAALSNPILWRKLLRYGWFFALPIMFLFKIHKLIASMFDCPWCIGYHLGWLVLYLVMGLPILQALLLAPMTLVFVTILNILHNK